MNSEEWVIALSELGKNISGYLINGFPAEMGKAVKLCHDHNPWFTDENIIFSLNAISSSLTKEKLEKWLDPYRKVLSNKNPKKIAVIMAGNIPAVGFHDFLCVLISGNIFMGKLSSQDKFLLPAIADELKRICPTIKENLSFAEERISDFDAVIATGSGNSSRYFEYYFGKYPHIIRKNRNSVAILTGNESRGELELLMDDIFLYFGLGCRNVTKIFVPEGYNFPVFIDMMAKYRERLSQHNKYMNNYDYNRSVFLINQVAHTDTGFCLLTEDPSLASPISVLHYEYYQNIKNVLKSMADSRDQVQCLVAKEKYTNYSVSFGQSQHPELWDYADGVDTLEFLKSVST